MGISAQQHRVATGMFSRYVIISKSNRGKRENLFSCLLSRHMLCALLGIFYFYVILYIFSLTIDANILPGAPLQPKIHSIPCLRSSINHYFMVIFCTIFLRHFKLVYRGERGIGTALTAIFNKLLSTTKTDVSPTMSPKQTVGLLFRITNSWLGTMSRCGLVFLSLLNISLIVICNCSLLNPGPNLSVVYNNVHGFLNTRDLASGTPPLNMTKIHEFHGYIYKHKPHIIILNETWLKNSILSNEVLPDKYKVFRLDRSLRSHPVDATQPKKFRKNGGGVLIAHRTDIDISSVKFSKVSVQAELLSVIIKTQCGRNFCISTFYRVGTLGLDNFESFKKHFVTLASARKLQRHILVGDFNLASVSWPDGQSSCQLHSSFVNFLTDDLGHTQLINSPTHKSGNTLDLVFTNIQSLIKNVKVLDQNEMCMSDHFCITFNIDVKTKYIKQPKRKIFNYSKGNFRGLNSELFSIDWDSIFECNDPYLAWSRFRGVLGAACDRWIPKKTIKSQFQPPWYDSECDRVLRNKEKWRIRHKGSNSESHKQKFRAFRTKFKNMMDERMRLSVEDDSDDALISKKFWTYVKSKSKSTRIPETVKYHNRFRNNPSDQAALFNEYFYEQFSQESDYGIDIDFRDDCFSSLVFSREDVLLILKKLNPNKAPGPDGIHGKVLKNCAHSLAYPLSVLFNLSFSTGCIPPDWKLALVVPVHKKGDKSSVENYRPISLTSLVMKVFERCIKTALYAACSDLLDNRQHGFVNERSCTTQMIPFTDNLALALNNRSRIDVIYFDFAKAFDSVSHDLILNKLKNIFNVDGLMLKFIKSYLEGRQQQVVVGGQTSSSLPVRSGVPQGSILGPLLFVIFINDMFSCVSEGTNIALYADDTKIWREIIGYPDHHIIQNDINRLYDWSVRNRMKFHPQKCKALSVSLQRNVLDNLPFNTFFYKLSGSDIDFVPSQSDLGVAINSRFNWGAQCKALVSKASSRLGLLKRTCHFTTDKRQKRSFYLALIRSIFEHCSVIWSPQTATHLEQFVAIQKRAIKWINGEPYSSYNDDKLATEQKKLDILPVKQKFIYNDLMTFYKIVNNIIPVSLPTYIVLCRPEGTRYTRHNAQIIDRSDTSTYMSTTVPCSDAFRNSFFHRSMLKWNSLPVCIRQSERISTFKVKLIKHLWAADTVWPD